MLMLWEKYIWIGFSPKYTKLFLGKTVGFFIVGKFWRPHESKASPEARQTISAPSTLLAFEDLTPLPFQRKPANSFNGYSSSYL